LPALAEQRPWERDVIGHVLPRRSLAEIPPLKLLRGLASCELALPPIYHLTGLRPASAERGEVTFVIPATDWLASFTGNVHGGVLALLLEAAASAAVWSMLPAGQEQLPLELKTSFLRPVPAEGGWILGTGRVLRSGRRVAYATSEAVTADGRTAAVAMSTHVVV
jgi:uncharacterized protein (TIGR00369 family)